MKTTEFRILESALKLFGEKGYNDTSLRDIAEIAGVNPSAINYHFVSKENLYKQVISTFGGEQIEMIMSNLGHSGDPVGGLPNFKKKLSRMTEELLKLLSKEPGMHQIFTKELMEGMPYAKEEFQEIVPEMVNRFHEFMKKAHKEGILKKGIDPYLATYTYFALMMNPFERKQYLKEFNILNLFSPKKREEYVQHTLEFYLSGVLN